MSTFSLYNSVTRKCLLKNGTAAELVERQRSYQAHGGNALLVVTRDDEEPRFPRPKNIAEKGEKVLVPITVDPPAPTPGENEAAQLSMLNVPPRVEVVSSKLLLERGQKMARFCLERAPEVGMNFTWSNVVHKVMGGKVPTTELTKTDPDRDSEFTFLKKSVMAIIELAGSKRDLIAEGKEVLD